MSRSSLPNGATGEGATAPNTSAVKLGTAAARDNWAHNQRSTPEVLIQPKQLDDLRSAVRTAVAKRRGPIVVRGSLHSWSPTAVQKGGVALDLSSMVEPPVIDKARGLVTVSGGMKLSALHDALASEGVALEFAPTIEDVTVAGAIATGTHGAARDGGVLGAQVVAMKLVDGLARVVSIDEEGCFLESSRGRHPLLAGSAPLQAARHHLGALGAVYEVTMRVVPAFDLEMVSRPMSASAAFGPNYRDLRAFFDAHEHGDFFWFVRQGRVLLRSADRTEAPRAPRSWLGRNVVDGLLRTRASSLAFEVLPHVPWLAPLVSLAGAYSFFGTTVIRDRSDRVETYLPGHANRSAGIRVMEHGVPYARMEEALDLIQKATAEFSMPVPMFVRRVDDRLYFELIWPSGLRGGEDTARRLESMLIEALGSDAMPHDGKVYFTNPWPRKSKEEVERFEKLKSVLDPGAMFTNEFMHAYLGGARDLRASMNAH